MRHSHLLPSIPFLVLCALVTSLLHLSGCGQSSTQPSSSGNSISSAAAANNPVAGRAGTPATPSNLALASLVTSAPATSNVTATIPAAGGTITIPEASAVIPQMTFDAGAISGTTISVTASGEAPTSLPQAKVGASSFYFISFTVNQPIALNLLRQVSLSGAVPVSMTQYTADVIDANGGETLGTVSGSFDGSTATFAAASTSAILQPDNRYVLQFVGVQQAGVTFNFQNNSGLDVPMYVLVTGFSANFPTDSKYYHLNKKFQLVPDAMSDAVITPAPSPYLTDIRTGYADYSIKVPQGGSITIPVMNGPRLYVSLGKSMPMQLTVNGGTAAQPVLFSQPDLAGNPNDPCYNNLIDFIELTLDGNIVGINMSEVNAIGVPLQVNVDGTRSGAPHTWQVGFKPGARQAIFTALGADTSFKSLAVPVQPSPDPGTKTVRFLNPSYGIANVVNQHSNTATFDPNFYQNYINQVWTKYKTDKLTMNTSAYGTFVGQVDGNGNFVFKQTASGLNKPPSTTYTIAQPQPYTTGMPSTTDPNTIGTYAALVGNVGVFTASPVDVVGGEIGGALSVGVCRTTLLVYPIITRLYPPYTDCPVAQYYTQSPINLFAKLIHDYSLPSADQPDGDHNWGGAYAFGLDDNCNQSSVLNVQAANVNSVTVVIPPFSAP